MTTSPDGEGPAARVTEAEVEAAAQALDPRLFSSEQNPASPFAGTLEQWRHGARYRARRILAAAAIARPDPSAELAALRYALAEERRMRGEAERDRDAARAVLRHCEWASIHEGGRGRGQCPECLGWYGHGPHRGHQPGCALVAALAAAPDPAPERRGAAAVGEPVDASGGPVNAPGTDPTRGGSFGERDGGGDGR